MRAALVLLVALAACGKEDTPPPPSVEGSVCGIPAIRGEVISAIDGPGACGINAPVRITEVAGVRLSSSARIDCDTARALHSWVEGSVKPAVEDMSPAASLHVMASYACRTRNSRRGAKLSEHAMGHAIDIGGVTLVDGTEISVLNDWGGGAKGRVLKALHSGACGPFGTVLGPNSDPYHKDHFHFDTARYRSGPYCR